MPQLPDDLLDYINRGREDRGLEYKERLEWVPRRTQGRAVLTSDQATLVKAVLAMSNIPNGGVLVIGVRDADGQPVGVTESEARCFTQDGVSAIVNEYAAPYCELTVTIGYTPNNKDAWFAVVEVSSFRSQPVICRRDGAGLEAGAIYTRSRRTYETAKVRSEAEMREIIDIAVDGALEREVSRLRGLGLLPEAGAPAIQNQERYDRERGSL